MSELDLHHAERLQRARLSLDGLSLGDAFGQQFFFREAWATGNNPRELPPGPWRYTDDTEMALAILQVLERHGQIDQDELAREFARRFQLAPQRGYGSGAIAILLAVSEGQDWRTVSRAVFAGQGSLGNGAAMRVAPLGGYFADDYDAVVEQAVLSAVVTHAHPEGIAGAIAIAVSAAWAHRWRTNRRTDPPTDLFSTVLARTPAGLVRDGIAAASELPLDTWEFTAAERLGSGHRVRASDTVPFCVWCIARHLDDFCEGLWTAARVEGDVDTNAAIIGGVLALAAGPDSLPGPWLASRESLAR